MLSINNNDSFNNMIKEVNKINKQMNKILEDTLPPEVIKFRKIIKKNQENIYSYVLQSPMINISQNSAIKSLRNVQSDILKNNVIFTNEIRIFIHDIEYMKNDAISYKLNSLYKLYGYPGDSLDNNQKENISKFYQNIEDDSEDVYNNLSSTIESDKYIENNHQLNNIKYNEFQSEVLNPSKKVLSYKDNTFVWTIAISIFYELLNANQLDEKVVCNILFDVLSALITVYGN